MRKFTEEEINDMARHCALCAIFGTNVDGKPPYIEMDEEEESTYEDIRYYFTEGFKKAVELLSNSESAYTKESIGLLIKAYALDLLLNLQAKNRLKLRESDFDTNKWIEKNVI